MLDRFVTLRRLQGFLALGGLLVFVLVSLKNCALAGTMDTLTNVRVSASDAPPKGRNAHISKRVGNAQFLTEKGTGFTLAFDAFAQGKGKPRKVNAATVFAANCARCHGADGKGTALGQSLETPDLTDGNVQNNMSNTKIRKVILNGDGPMPAFKSKLTAAQVTALTGYVRTFKGK